MESIKQSPPAKKFVAPTEMDFLSALKEAAEGKKVRRLEWEDKGVYLTFNDEKLMIFLTDDKKLHPLIVSAGDIMGDDWIVVTENPTIH